MALTVQSAAPAPQLGNALPDHPIIGEQLTTLLEEMHMAAAQKVLVHESLKAQHKLMPSWFPVDVWAEVESRIEAIDIAAVDLPVYQKYVSQDQATSLILFFQGPTGDRIGQSLAERSLESINSAGSGIAPEPSVAQSAKLLADGELWAKRLEELTAPDRSKIRPAIDYLRSVLPLIGDEQNVAYNKKVNEEFNTVLKMEQKKIAAAEIAAAGQTHTQQ